MFSFKAQDTGHLLVPRLIFISSSFLHPSDQHPKIKTSIKQRKNKIVKKPQSASTESITHMVQWQLRERNASKMPVPLNRKMI